MPWPKDRKPSREIAFRRGCGRAAIDALLRCGVAGPGLSQKERAFWSWPAVREAVLRLRSLVLLAPRPSAVRDFMVSDQPGVYEIAMGVPGHGSSRPAAAALANGTHETRAVVLAGSESRHSATLSPSSRNRRSQNESPNSGRRKSLFCNGLANHHTLRVPHSGPTYGRHARARPRGARRRPRREVLRGPQRLSGALSPYPRSRRPHRWDGRNEPRIPADPA